MSEDYDDGRSGERKLEAEIERLRSEVIEECAQAVKAYATSSQRFMFLDETLAVIRALKER